MDTNTTATAKRLYVGRSQTVHAGNIVTLCGAESRGLGSMVHSAGSREVTCKRCLKSLEAGA